MAHQEKIKFLPEMSLLKGLSEEELSFLNQRVSEEIFPSNEVILNEGDNSSELYLIAEGEVSILKWDEEHKSQMPLGRLMKGEMFGEMSFMDGSPRSSTVKTIKETKLLKLSKEALVPEAKESQNIKSTLFANIAVANINRLRESNKLYVKNLRSHLRSFQIRQDCGQLLLKQLLILGICFFVARFFNEEIWGYLPWILAALPTLFLINKNDYDLSRFGINFYHFPTVLLTSLGLCLLIWLGDHFFSSVFQLSQSENWMLNLRPNFSKALPFSSIIVNVGFYAIFCFAYEFLARGVLQTSIQEFLSDQKGYISIVVTAGLLLILQLSLGNFTAMEVFVSSLFLGLVFLFQKSIWGVFLIHFITGILL